jgi:8-oxo-dGTP pyrophosphatase MutT (NUDIX family)
MGILTFNQFVNEGYKDIDPDLTKNRGVGVAVVYDNKLLLVHPTGASWKKGTCGIPKGGLEPGEDLKTGAIRELFEETGIRIQEDQLEDEPQVVDFYTKNGKVYRQLIYYVCKIGDLSEIGLNSEKISKSQLQTEEIDWAKFVGPKEAYPIMVRAQLIILDRLLDINK